MGGNGGKYDGKSKVSRRDVGQGKRKVFVFEEERIIMVRGRKLVA